MLQNEYLIIVWRKMRNAFRVSMLTAVKTRSVVMFVDYIPPAFDRLYGSWSFRRMSCDRKFQINKNTNQHRQQFISNSKSDCMTLLILFFINHYNVTEK